MRFSESEIVEDVLEHIRQAGGEFREWRVGTKDSRQWAEGSRQSADSLLCRQAYTIFAAQEVVERLAQGFGLQLDRETTPNRAATSHPGKTVYVYRPVKVVAAA